MKKAFVFPGETALTAENHGAATQIAVTVFEDDSEELKNAKEAVIPQRTLKEHLLMSCTPSLCDYKLYLGGELLWKPDF